jgi:hypothetical protein
MLIHDILIPNVRRARKSKIFRTTGIAVPMRNLMILILQKCLKLETHASRKDCKYNAL